MPQKIFMFIPSGTQHDWMTTTTAVAAALPSSTKAVGNSASASKSVTAGMGSMIARIHDARPGCGSCGRSR